MFPLEVSWGHLSIRLLLRSTLGFRTPFSASLKQEFWAESLIQVVSQMGPSGGRQKGNFGIIHALNCAPCLELENPSVVLYPSHSRVWWFQKRVETPRKEIFWDSSPGQNRSRFCGVLRSCSGFFSFAVPKILEWRAGKGRSSAWGGGFPAEVLRNTGMKIPGLQMRGWSSWEGIQGRIETRSFPWDVLEIEEFGHHQVFWDVSMSQLKGSVWEVSSYPGMTKNRHSPASRAFGKAGKWWECGKSCQVRARPGTLE